MTQNYFTVMGFVLGKFMSSIVVCKYTILNS